MRGVHGGHWQAHPRDRAPGTRSGPGPARARARAGAGHSSQARAGARRSAHPRAAGPRARTRRGSRRAHPRGAGLRARTCRGSRAVSIEPVAEPLVGFRRWGAKRGGLYSGIFVAGKFVPNPALGMVAPRAAQMPWPTDFDRFAKCFALRGHDAPHRDCNCGWAAYYALDDEPELPAIECVWGAVVAWGKIVECETGFRAE